MVTASASALRAFLGQAMTDLSSCPKTTACKTDSKCQTAFFVIQAHHDHCKHDTLTTEEEKAMHAYETYCTNCQIYRAFAEGNKDCFFMPDKAEEKSRRALALAVIFQVSRCRKGALNVLAVQISLFTFPPPLYRII